MAQPKVSDLVEDDQLGTDPFQKEAGQLGGGLGRLRRLGPLVETSEANGISRLHRSDSEGDRQHRLTQAGRTQESDVVVVVDEAQAAALDLSPIEGGLSLPVELLEAADEREVAGGKAALPGALRAYLER